MLILFYELVVAKTKAQKAKEGLEEERCHAPDLEKGIIITYKESDGFQQGLLRSG